MICFQIINLLFSIKYRGMTDHYWRSFVRNCSLIWWFFLCVKCSKIYVYNIPYQQGVLLFDIKDRHLTKNCVLFFKNRFELSIRNLPVKWPQHIWHFPWDICLFEITSVWTFPSSLNPCVLFLLPTINV